MAWRSLGRGYAILDKIRQVDKLITPDLQERFREVHPEVAFCVLNRRPLVHRKKTAEGQQERLAILRQHGKRSTKAVLTRSLALRAAHMARPQVVT